MLIICTILYLLRFYAPLPPPLVKWIVTRPIITKIHPGAIRIDPQKRRRSRACQENSTKVRKLDKTFIKREPSHVSTASYQRDHAKMKPGQRENSRAGTKSQE